MGTQTAVTLKGQVSVFTCCLHYLSFQEFRLNIVWLQNLQTDQMGRIVNELDTIQFSIKKASQLVKEIGRQVGWDLTPLDTLLVHFSNKCYFFLSIFSGGNR